MNKVFLNLSWPAGEAQFPMAQQSLSGILGFFKNDFPRQFLQGFRVIAILHFCGFPILFEQFKR